MSRYLSRVKGLLSDDRDRSWRSWAAQKLQRKNNTSDETLTLFPGWAARRYHPGSDTEAAAFDIEASVSGYATCCRSNGQTTRSQRAFIRIAKGFAALPRITDQPTSPEEHFNPLGDDFKALERQFRSMNTEDGPDAESPAPSFLTNPPRQMNTPLDVLQKLHYNLESRIQLFWSSCLSARTVRLHLFASPRDSLASDAHYRHVEDDAHRPIATMDVVTAVDGSFNARFHIPWQELCQHHRGVYIAFGLPAEEHDLVIVAELLPPPIIHTSASTPNITSQSAQDSHLKPSSSSHLHTSSQSNIYLHVPPHVDTPVQHSPSQSHPHINALLNSLSNSLSSSSSFLSSSLSTLHSTLVPSSTSLTHTTLPITHSPIRVISDIDDTVKMSGITEGARAVFNNVFVRELKDGIIPGMGEWYTNMWERGVRFHYVSNGPFEYLSLLHEFFSLSKLPPGSIKLKSYAGRSLLSGLLSAPAARKRAGVIEILDSFPDSKFILIGDSGEQDLELYADLARDRQDQILAVFIRDADETSYTPIRDPTGWEMVDAGKAGTRFDTEPLLDYGSSSAPSSAASSPRLEFSDFPGIGGDDEQRQQQMTPRARMQRRSSGPEDNARGSTTPFRTDRQALDEDSMDTLDTPRQKSIPLFQSPTITPSTSGFVASPKPMTKMSSYISTPPPPIHPLRLPSSSSSSSQSSPTLPPSRSTNHFRQNGNHGVDRPRTVKVASDPPPLAGRGNDDQYERSRLSTNVRTTHRNNTIGPSLSSSGPSSAVSYMKPSSRLSFPGFGIDNTWDGTHDGRRVTSANSATTPSRHHGGRNHNGSISSSGASSHSSHSNTSSTAFAMGSGGGLGKSESEKKRGELQVRVYTARTQMPSRVLLRVFRHPGECVGDVERILGV